jgi:hypothetical protein
LKEAIKLYLEEEILEDLGIVPNPAIIANIELDNILYA